MKKHVLLLVVALAGCSSEPERPDWIELDQPVEYDILAFSVDERASVVAEALAASSTEELIAPMDSERRAAGSAVAVSAFGSVRGGCVVGACRDVYLELVDEASGESLGLLEVRDVFADVSPSAGIIADPPQGLTLLPAPVAYRELGSWLSDQSHALTFALLAQDAEAHARNLQSKMTESAASLVVRRFVSAGRDGDCANEGCRDTYVQLQQQEWGQLTPYTVGTLRIRSFDDPTRGYEVEVLDSEE